MSPNENEKGRRLSPDVYEDWLALNSREYVQSIEEARKDYAAGHVTPLEDIIAV